MEHEAQTEAQLLSVARTMAQSESENCRDLSSQMFAMRSAAQAAIDQLGQKAADREAAYAQERTGLVSQREAADLRLRADIEEQQCENWKCQAEELESDVLRLSRAFQELESAAQARPPQQQLVLAQHVPAQLRRGDSFGTVTAFCPRLRRLRRATVSCQVPAQDCP